MKFLRSLDEVVSNERGSFAPYLVGWLLGVPASLLFLIAILRTIF